MRINYISADIYRKITEKAVQRTRDNFYKSNIKLLHRRIHTAARNGEYRYQCSYDEKGATDAHMIDRIKQHFTSLGFKVNLNYSPANEYNLAVYFLNFSWDAAE